MTPLHVRAELAREPRLRLSPIRNEDLRLNGRASSMPVARPLEARPIVWIHHGQVKRIGILESNGKEGRRAYRTAERTTELLVMKSGHEGV